MNRHAFFGILLIVLNGIPVSAQERFRRTPPYPEPLSQVVLPDIQSWTLSNDLELSLVRVPDIPRICIHLEIYTGDASSPEGKPGMASFTANMIGRRSDSSASADFEESIDSMGGEFFVRTFPDYTLFSLSFLEEHLDQALELISDMILNPFKDRAEMEAVKRIMTHGMARRMRDAEVVGRSLLRRLLFDKHGYSGSIYTEDSIRGINRRDLQLFFDKFYRPNNAHMTIVGNLSQNSASRRISRFLNTWKTSPLEIHHYTPPAPNRRLRICFIPLPHARDVFIGMGNILPSKSKPDFFALQVFNQVMGGSHISRLFMNLRESKGYAYWAYSSVESYKTCGVFMIRARVRPESVSSAVLEILDQIRVGAGQPFPPQELEQSKSYLIGHYPITLMTHESLASRVSEIQAFGLGPEHWNEYIRNIMYVDARMVFETVREIPLSTPVIVIVGDQDMVLERLRNFEEIEIYDKQGHLQYKVIKEN